MLNHIDLFSGIGGFALACKSNGIETVVFCEKDRYCQKVLNKNFSGVPIIDDIKQFDGKAFADTFILSGGFPCQPFSVAGKRRGTHDDRYLWPEMLRVISEARPYWVIAENVAGIVNMELDTVLSDLENQAYETQSFIIPACSVDAPHKRDRVWIIANDAKQINRKNNSKQSKRQVQQSGISYSKADVADTNETGLQGRNKRGERTSQWTIRKSSWPDEADWFAESGICRVSNGIPQRVDRLRSLGNAIVPQVAAEIIRNIVLIEANK